MLRTGQFMEHSKHYTIDVILILQILAPALNPWEGSFIPSWAELHISSSTLALVSTVVCITFNYNHQCVYVCLATMHK